MAFHSKFSIRAIFGEEIETVPRPVNGEDHRERPNLERPKFSYDSLIMIAIRASPNRRSTLAEIYNYIEKHFAYYRTCKTDWQNAIRHNLSMNEYFVRSPRELDEPGRGGYWSLSFAGQHSFVGNDTGRLRQPPVPPVPIMNCYFVPAPVMGGVVAYQYENSGAVGGMYYQMAGPILQAPEDEVGNILR